jgi:pimeloyl-ACP methyl ester carboxylesterase
VPHLTDRYPVLRFDKWEHNLSDCPAAPYSIHDFSTDLLGLLDKLEISQAIIVGIFVGGIVAMDFAAGWQERVHLMVLCDTPPVIGTPDLWNDRINRLREQGMGSMAEAILARWFSPAFKENLPAAYQGYYNMLTRMPLEGYTGTCEAIRDADLTAAARTIEAYTCPRRTCRGVQVHTLYICPCGHCQEIIRGYSTTEKLRKERESA